MEHSLSDRDSPGRVALAIGPLRHLRALTAWLEAAGWQVVPARSADDLHELIEAGAPTALILDSDLPGLGDATAAARWRAIRAAAWFHIIMLVEPDEAHCAAAVAAGADELLTRPVSQVELQLRLRSLIRWQRERELVQRQAAELAHWRHTTEARARRQVEELDRIGRLGRILPRAVVERLLAAGQEPTLESHRREISVLFCDLRGFTGFAEIAEPEEVMAVLREYHAALEPLVAQFEGTIGFLAGDGLMVFFNDPLPCRDPAARAVRLAMAMHERMRDLVATWQRAGHELGFGVGVAMGFATLGRVGFEGRHDYGAIGSVVNLASRLCDEARPGQVLVSAPVFVAVDGLIEAAELPPLNLKGFLRPVTAYSVVGMRATPLG